MKVNSFLSKTYNIAALAAVLSLILGLNLPVEAQDSITGAVEGTVVDKLTRTPIQGADVSLINEESGIKLIKRTNENGRFRQGLLPPGDYRIQISASTYRTREIRIVNYATRVNEAVPSPIELEPIITRQIEKNTGALAVASLPNAVVSVESLEDSAVFKQAIPLDQSLCVFDGLPPKRYRVTATLGGYQSARSEITIAPHKTLPLTLRLLPNVASARILAQSGRYYALVIGNNTYRHVRSLRTAVNDAKAVETNLRERYGFETRLLVDADREQIMAALNEYRRKVEPNASLLIYYAGHGYNDTEVEKAYWLPVNARKEDNANWISADDITTGIKGIPAKHILLVSDSCYSGTITRTPELGLVKPDDPEGTDKYLQKMSAGKSRTLMASGGNEPVADSGGEGHSVFANAFLAGLTKMDHDIFSAEQLYYNFIRFGVSGNSNQTPEYNPIRNSGHETGDFVFLRKRQ